MPFRIIPREGSDLDPAGEEIRVLVVHATIVVVVVVAATALAILHRISAAVIATLLGSALTFGGARSSQISGRGRRADRAKREQDPRGG